MNENLRMEFFESQTGYTVEDDVIRNVSVATIGPAKGKGVHIDAAFINDIMSQGAANARGIKARFGHPSFGADAIGSYLGRIKNFRVEGDKVRGDLHLSKAASKSPRGDLCAYVKELANTDPDQFGLSVAFDHAGIFLVNGDKRRYVKLGKLVSVDVVDEPAANPTGLFDSIENVLDTKTNATETIKEVLKMNPDEMKKWVTKFGAAAAEYFAAGLSLEQAEMRFSEDNAKAERSVMAEAIKAKDAKIADMETQFSTLSKKISELEDKNKTLSSGANAVTMSVQPDQKPLTFEAVVSGMMTAGKVQFEAVREAANAHPDLHKVWLADKKTKFNTVV